MQLPVAYIKSIIHWTDSSEILLAARQTLAEEE